MSYNLTLPTTTTANGIWTLDQAVYYQESNSWPVSPCSPTIGSITVLSGTTINVAFTAPSYNGSAAITGYSVTSNTGTYANGTISPITVTGLANGTSYTFIVQAKNSVGTGKPSAVSAANTTFKVPNAPTIGAVSSYFNSCTNAFVANVAFTTSTCNGGTAITSYTATSCPSGITGTGTSSPIYVSGLGVSSTYTFKVKAQNLVGFGPCSSASAANTTPALPPGSHNYTTGGTYTWVAPPGISSVSVVAIGAGGGEGTNSSGGGSCCTGGRGGMLRYVNSISVTGGTSYTVVVGSPGQGGQTIGYSMNVGRTDGGSSYFINTSTVYARGGVRNGCATSSYYSSGVGTGGNGGQVRCCSTSGGGSGAGGYSGDGGRGGFNCYYGALPGNGGGGAGGVTGAGSYSRQNSAGVHGGGGGGGVGIFGAGCSGSISNRAQNCGTGGGGGSGGSNGQTGYSFYQVVCGQGNNGYNCYWQHGGAGGTYGGGGGGVTAVCSGPYARAIAGNGGVGAVRILWPGATRSYPSANVASP